jgi:hypothetical protein
VTLLCNSLPTARVSGIVARMKTSRASALALVAALILPSLVLAVDPPPGGGYPNQNTALGDDALFDLNTTASQNTALGFEALYNNVYGSSNTAVGASALFTDTGDYGNTAVGAGALSITNCTQNNTAVGYFALAGTAARCAGDWTVAIGYEAMAEGGGLSCTAVGSFALMHNAGQLNTAIGEEALAGNTGGIDNTATGWRCLFQNSGGSENTAAGLEAMFFNRTGSHNTAMGATALQSNLGGDDNAAYGQGALRLNTSGHSNTAAGTGALRKNRVGNGNTAEGFGALRENVTGSGNIAFGVEAGDKLTGSDNIAIGSEGVAGEANTIRIGSAQLHKAVYVAGVHGTTISDGVAVMVNSNGQLGVATSSARFKDDIQPMKDASDVLLSLQPVTFRYKKELDSLGTPQFGLVAEQVAKVDPNLVARDDSGQPYTVRYEAVNAMLLNEFLKEHRTVAAQNAQIELLEKRLGEQDKINAEMRAALGAQAEQIQKVNAQLATQQPAARLVSNLQ